MLDFIQSYDYFIGKPIILIGFILFLIFTTNYVIKIKKRKTINSEEENYDKGSFTILMTFSLLPFLIGLFLNVLIYNNTPNKLQILQLDNYVSILNDNLNNKENIELLDDSFKKKLNENEKIEKILLYSSPEKRNFLLKEIIKTTKNYHINGLEYDGIERNINNVKDHYIKLINEKFDNNYSGESELLIKNILNKCTNCP